MGQIENLICALFEKTTQMHPVVARAVFFSASGFNGRVEMLLSAMRVVNFEDPNYKKFLILLIKRSREYAGVRNRLAHGSILRVEFQGSAYYKQTIILEGGQHWVADPPPDKVLTGEKISTISVNFTNLLAYLSLAVSGPPQGATADFTVYHGQVALLPSDARCLPSSPEVAENVIPLLNSLQLRQ